MFDFITNLFGSSQERTIKKFRKIVSTINLYDEMFSVLSDEELKLKTQEFRNRLNEGETLDHLLPEAYAVVKNTCRRLTGTHMSVSGYNQKWDMVPYDVQIIGAIAMHKGFITEMQTGEGKTLTATMPLYLNALTGKPVHLVTVNDYLAQRDCEWVGSVLRWLGLSTGVLVSGTSQEKRKEIYQKDVVYGTASEFGFDYLRDNSMAVELNEQVGRGFYFAIIDEVDSVLIDEARTPLIISGPGGEANPVYQELKDDVASMVKLQRDLCNRIATESKELFAEYLETETLPKNSKMVDFIENVCRKLWVVSKGMPLNRILRRVREHPDLRAILDKWDTYYHSEQNKDEAMERLSDLYLVLDERSNDFELTDKGIQAWADILGGSADDFVMLDMGHEYALIDKDETLSDAEKINNKLALTQRDTQKKMRVHALRQLLRAHLLMEKDVDYIVDSGQVIIIDEHTGRPQPGRRFADGLHQSIEAKEGVMIHKENQTYATVTLQNFFRLYEKLSGMTGTAITESTEFKEIYSLYVLQIPTYKPCIRHDYNDEFYMTEREKYNGIIKEIVSVHSQGRPILVGTESVEVSEKLSRILRQHSVNHTVLNAKNHAKEAEIIAEAGRLGAVTVATNMAGRGTDIKLDQEAVFVGGLHLIGTTRHQSRRIDRQLRGRCARLGDPGSSKFFLSFEDKLMRLFASPKINALIRRFRPPEGEAIADRFLNRLIETAQKRVEGRNYTMRKHTLDYDDVMNKQRQEIYSFRDIILQAEDLFREAEAILKGVVEVAVNITFGGLKNKFDIEGFRNWMMSSFPVTITVEELRSYSGKCSLIIESVSEVLIRSFRLKYEEMAQSITNSYEKMNAESICQDILRSVIISHIDTLWKEHLVDMDLLRSEVSLRTVGQKDPLLEFKQEGFLLFEALVRDLQIAVAKHLFQIELAQRPRTDIVMFS